MTGEISSEKSEQAAETQSAEIEPSERRVIKRYSNRKLYDTKESRYVTLQQIADMVRAGVDVQIINNATKEDKTDVTMALIISEELKAKPRGIPLQTLKALIRNRGEKLLTTLREGPIGRLIPKEQVPVDAAAPDQIVVEQLPNDPNESSLEGATPEAAAAAAGLSDANASSSSAHPSAPAPSTTPNKPSATDKEPSVTETKDAKGLQRVIQTSRATLEQWQAAIDERINTVLPDFSPLKDLKHQLATLNERLDKLEHRLDRLEPLDSPPEPTQVKDEGVVATEE